MDVLFLSFMGRFDPIMIPVIAIICGTMIAITAIIKGKNPPSDKPEEEEASRTIQEIYAQCNRLADRIEALETIILEREQRNKPDSSR